VTTFLLLEFDWFDMRKKIERTVLPLKNLPQARES
jgi:hypothetical protein